MFTEDYTAAITAQENWQLRIDEESAEEYEEWLDEVNSQELEKF